MRKLWINGQEVDGSEGTQVAIDPATEEIIAEYAWGGTAEADQAVAAAKGAFDGWRRTPAGTRAEMLHEIARRMRQEQESLAVDLTRETGRALRKNRGYVEWSAQCFDYYAELGRHSRGRV